MSEPNSADSSPSSDGPLSAADARPRGARRTSTRIDRALSIGGARPHEISALVAILGHDDPVRLAEENLARVERETADRLASHRARRDFAREIQGLDAVGRAMVRAGLTEIGRAWESSAGPDESLGQD